jgi:hypothetical protein
VSLQIERAKQKAQDGWKGKLSGAVRGLELSAGGYHGTHDQNSGIEFLQLY